MAGKICILGASLDSNNRGVAALAASLIQLLRGDCESGEVALFVGSRTNGIVKVPGPEGDILVTVHGWRLNPRAGFGQSLPLILLAALIYRAIPLSLMRRKLLGLSPPLKVLIDADLVGDVGGGDSFSDIYGMKRFFINLMPLFTTIVLGKKFILFPQTYGPYRTKITEKVAQLIMKRAELIMTRDRFGVKVVKGLVKSPCQSSRIKFCPDVAFSLYAREPDSPKFREIKRLRHRHSVPLVGINISGLLFSGGYSRDNMFDLKMDYRAFSLRLLRTLLEETTAQVFLVPHTYGKKGTINSDPDACEQLLEAHALDKDRVRLVTGVYNQSEIKSIIGLMDFFIGARMHSCIAALSQGIPTVGVAYSRKFVGVFETLKQSQMIVDARSCDEAVGVALVLSRYQAKEEIRRQLAPEAERVQNLVTAFFQSIREKYLDG